MAAAIERINLVLRTVCEDHEIAFVAEPYAISLEVADDPGLVADDGLHPSGEQYRRWTDAIAPIVEDLLRD
jgi:acyl-CoA thioesterase I